MPPPRPIPHATAVTIDGYDATEVVTGVTEVLCYGTAVVMVPA